MCTSEKENALRLVSVILALGLIAFGVNRLTSGGELSLWAIIFYAALFGVGSSILVGPTANRLRQKRKESRQ